jgi:spore germination cell wall hydrolase CwlJ-like protein
MRFVLSTLLALASAPASAQLTTLPGNSPPAVVRILLDDAEASRVSDKAVTSPEPAAPPTTAKYERPSAPMSSIAALSDLVDAQALSTKLTDNLRCMAAAIYFEARGEPLAGQFAVGRVIVNRATSGRFPSNYCGVVYQPSQFSFLHGRSMPAINTASQDWRKAVAIAHIAHAGDWHSPAEGALYFHAASISPGWQRRRVARIENHIFYR